MLGFPRLVQPYSVSKLRLAWMPCTVIPSVYGLSNSPASFHPPTRLPKEVRGMVYVDHDTGPERDRERPPNDRAGKFSTRRRMRCHAGGPPLGRPLSCGYTKEPGSHPAKEVRAPLLVHAGTRRPHQPFRLSHLVYS